MKTLSRNEMKAIWGGTEPVGGNCDNWPNAGAIICLNCCIAWHNRQPGSTDPDFVLNHCLGQCDL